MPGFIRRVNPSKNTVHVSQLNAEAFLWGNPGEYSQAMIDWLVYIMTGGFAGILLSLVVSIFKVAPGKPEFNFGRCVALCMAFTYAAPFAFVEFQSKKLGDDITAPVHYYFDNESTLNGDITKIKVLFATKETATVYMAVDEMQSWGGVDHPLAKLTLKKKDWKAKNGKEYRWKVIHEEVIRSDRMSKEGVVWPPY